MSDKVTAIAVSVTPQASFDIERLDDFLWEQQDPLAGDLYAYLIKALRLLERQPGVGRPVGGDLRELIIGRGRSGYLARYQYQPDVQTVTVLRIRHQSESGYTLDEI
jgi:plasmid stabilization system protein ParE